MEPLLDAIRQLENQPDVKSEDGYVIDLRSVVVNLLDRIRSEADEVLITDQGQLNLGNLERLKQNGYEHRIFEQDNYGPLVCGIKTRHGWVIYG